jgi:phosphate transport system substrate-binding protein
MNTRFGKIMAGLQLALLLVGTPLLLSSGQSRGKMIQIKGSDTLVNLVQILSEEYMAKNPNTPIAVLGGGSGTGITALINGTTDICNTSRDWKQKEYDLAWEKGIKVRLFVVAVDGLSIIVNEKNPLAQLPMPVVGAIYRGEIKNWKAVGGPDKPISLYGRQSNSGTYTFLMEHVMGNKPYSTDMKEMNGNAQIIDGVLNDEGAIGYSGVGYVTDRATGKPLKGLKVLNISKDAKSEAFSPLERVNIDSGRYPISRPLYQAVNGKPRADVAAFIAWEAGPEGQKIVEREGFFPISPAHAAQNDKNMK